MNIKRLILASAWALFGFWHPANADPQPGLKFVRNKTQWPCEVDFKVNVPSGNLALQAGLLTYTFLDQRMLENLHEQTHSKFKEVNHQTVLGQTVRGQIIQASFLESNPNSIPQPLGKYAEYYNYFLGNDTSSWSSDVSAYEGMIYPNFYNGIDLKIYSQGQHLKYDFIVSPGTDLSAIRFEYKGAENIYLENGDLVVHTSLVNIIEKKPYIY